jgi:hypothetical protein
MLNAEVRLVEMTARETWELDAQSNQWTVISRDKPVSEQFNEWADSRDMNPHGACSITTLQIQEAPNRITMLHVLCASVMSRRDQGMLELSYREQVERLLRGINSPGGGAPGAAPGPLPTGQAANAAPAGTPPVGGGITPVKVDQLGDTAPVAPGAAEGAATFPAAPLPNPGAHGG